MRKGCHWVSLSVPSLVLLQVSLLGDSVLLSLWLLHHTLPWCFLLPCLQALSPTFCFLHCPPFSPLGWPQSGSARLFKETLELPECGLGPHEPHHIDKQNKKRTFLPPNLEVKWCMKICHGVSLERKTPKLVVGINERSNVGSGLVLVI